MKRIYVKDKAFLKNFLILLLVFILVASFTIISVYQMSLAALKEEIGTMSSNMVKELKYRLEDMVDQCNNAASRLLVDTRVQLFFTHENPEILVDNYHEEISKRMNLEGLSFVDSVYLYAPKYEKCIFLQNMSTGSYELHTLETILDEEKTLDYSWLACIPEGERFQTDISLRAKQERWPYYFSITKHFQSNKIDGVVVININLQKLYEQLITDRDENLRFYVIDEEARVILRPNKKELFLSVEQMEELEQYAAGACFSKVRIEGQDGTAYAQDYSEDYGLTCVTISPVGDYLVRIVQLQVKFLWISAGALILVILFAAIYSLRMVRPLRELRELLDGASDNLLEDTDSFDEAKYTEEVRDIADRIVSHLQTNSSLRKELDARLDLLKDTQMIALQAQINPHFLFNTLNTASLLLQSDGGDDHPAAKMLSELSAVLRYSLSENENVSIGEEIAYIKHYLSVMKYRYEGVATLTDVQEEACDCAIPKMLLQPLVENALQHGISACQGRRQGELAIYVRKVLYMYKSGRELPSICIRVEDNGIGMGTDKLEELRLSLEDHSTISRSHIGVANVAQRLYLLFKEEQEFSIESVLGRGTKVEIIFPALNYLQCQEA